MSQPRRRRTDLSLIPSSLTAQSTPTALPAEPLAVTPDSGARPGDRMAMIAQAAYFRAERRNFCPGGELEDWLTAEREIDASLSAATALPREPTAA